MNGKGIALRVAECLHAGVQTIAGLIERGRTTKAQAYLGVRVLSELGVVRKRQLYRGVPARYSLLVPIEQVRAALGQADGTRATGTRFDAHELLQAWGPHVHQPTVRPRFVDQGWRR